MCTRNHEFAVTARALVICAGVQENGKLPTENEPKIGFSLQNVRTVNVEGLPGLFRYRFTKQQRLLQGGAPTMYNGCFLPNS
ncbi:unnamed protein product [Brassica napus]|uniref:(rape) hypothetical protein n=1 Tax=Brassica napus TaxID=3708 RepID=A0A817AVM6_BRANA|nr:unnamed protein product [Brassica napus]